MTMGEKILNMRKARGWNQEELAERIGVTRQAVSRWESDSAKPDADKLLLLSDLFSVSTDFLLRDDVETDTTKHAATTIVLPLTPRLKRTLFLFAAACLILGCVLAAACFRPPRDIHEVLEQKRFEIQGQVEWDVPVVLDVSALSVIAISGEMTEFIPGKYTVYEWDNSKLSLVKVWKPYDDLFALMFHFTYDLPREGAAITTTFANLGEGTYTNKVRIQDENLYSDSLVYQDALQLAGTDSYGFAVYIPKDVLEQVDGEIEFTVNGLNRLVYKRDR